MTMAGKGVPKLIEECGGLIQVCGKRLAYYTTDEHPDGTNLQARMIEEMGDVLAAIDFVTEQFDLDRNAIHARKSNKVRTFALWDAEPDNNINAIDGKVEP